MSYTNHFGGKKKNNLPLCNNRSESGEAINSTSHVEHAVTAGPEPITGNLSTFELAYRRFRMLLMSEKDYSAEDWEKGFDISRSIQQERPYSGELIPDTTRYSAHGSE